MKSVLRPCGLEVPSSKALDMSGSPYLTIGYLPKDEREALRVIALGMVG